jgi:hypothetical protein
MFRQPVVPSWRQTWRSRNKYRNCRIGVPVSQAPYDASRDALRSVFTHRRFEPSNASFARRKTGVRQAVFAASGNGSTDRPRQSTNRKVK